MLKTVAKYPKFCATVKPILLPFLRSCILEFGFKHVHYLLSKQQQFEHEYGELWLNLINLQPNIFDFNAYKTYPFYKKWFKN